MGSTPTTKQEWKASYTPPFHKKQMADLGVTSLNTETGEVTVSVTVSKGKEETPEYRESTNEAKTKLYSDFEQLLKAEYHSSLDELLDEINKLQINQAKANARQAGYVILAGPAKAIYVVARKMYRDSVSWGSPMNPKDAFEFAQQGYAYIPGAMEVVFDEKKVIGEKEPEAEESND